MAKTRVVWIFTLDILILILSFLIMAAYKPGTPNYLSWRYLTGFGILVFTWLIFSGYFKKYVFKKKVSLNKILRRILISNLFSISILSVFMMAFSVTSYSRLVFFGTAAIATILEIFLANLYYLLIHTSNGKTDLLNPPPRAYELKKAGEAINYSDVSVSENYISEAITGECGDKAYNFIKRHLKIEENKILCLSTTTRFNVEFQPDNYFRKIINLRRVNDIQYINKFFETVNRKLPAEGLFMGRVETKEQRKKRVLKKFPPGLNWIFYSIDFLIKRVFPKFMLTKKLYFLLTRGQNRVLSRAELLGRLYSCGFTEVDEKDIDGYYYFVMKKESSPVYDMNPTYGPFIKLSRVGKDGKLIRVYKFRTMHPYSEYLQDYVFRKNYLADGGKFNNDFRITSLGKIMRKLWLDELPMLFNIIKGDLKLVGVRPLSEHYFNLYNEELRNIRVHSKPGLIPPFYADLPKTLEEIQESEMRYLKAWKKHPVLTDIRYFRKAIWNIFMKRARSG